MPSRIVFLPIEPYNSRYTQYTSVVDGVYESCFKDAGVRVLSIRPDWNIRTLKQGQVLDVVARTQWGFNQVSILVDMIMNGGIDPREDVIYLEDFWTPGFEQIMYAMSSKFGPNPMEHAKVYSFCHAQTFDPNDFTAKWAWWMRPLEKLWFEYQAGVFCASNQMIPLMAEAGVPIIQDRRYKIMPIGHWFHRKAMLRIAGINHFVDADWKLTKKKQVVYSSRWDIEKNPNFFMDLVELVLAERDDINFVVCSGQARITSNNDELMIRLQRMVLDYDPRFKALQGLSLNHYYNILGESRVQFNCALQDWISYTLLDATINGCAPLYPHWLSFPDALNHNKRYLYANMDLEAAKKKLYTLIDSEDEDVSWVYRQYENTGKKAMKAMGFKV